jgi:hypothetical protein
MSGNIIIYVKMEIAFEYTIHKDIYFPCYVKDLTNKHADLEFQF